MRVSAIVNPLSVRTIGGYLLDGVVTIRAVQTMPT